MNKTESAATDYLKYLESERDKLLQQWQQQPRPTQRSTTTDSNLNTTVYKWNPKGTAPSTGCGLYCLLVPGCVQDRHGFLSEVGKKKMWIQFLRWYNDTKKQQQRKSCAHNAVAKERRRSNRLPHPEWMSYHQRVPHSHSLRVIPAWEGTQVLKHWHRRQSH